MAKKEKKKEEQFLVEGGMKPDKTITKEEFEKAKKEFNEKMRSFVNGNQ